MSRAYASTLHISFDVRGGLLIRQIHHWAALLFVAAMLSHMFRMFFTGALPQAARGQLDHRRLLLILGIVEGFAGYSLPDDLLSGTGLRIADAIMLSIPVIGTWVSFAVFGGEFPGDDIIPRLYIVHVLLIPAIILALIAVHVGARRYQKHTQFPGPGATENNVVGERMLPDRSRPRAAGSSSSSSACVAALGGLFQINPIWLFGPYNPAQVSVRLAAGLVHGLPGRLDPICSRPGRSDLLGTTDLRRSSGRPSCCPAIMITLARALSVHRGADDQGQTRCTTCCSGRGTCRCAPSLGAMALTFYVVLLISGGNDLFAYKFDISLNAMTWVGRIALIVLPPLAYVGDLPALPRPAAARPGGARARHRDRHHQAAADR